MPSSAEEVAGAVAYALAQVGKPYVDTPPGANPPSSWDCSKLTSWAWREGSNGRLNLTPYTKTQVQECVPIKGVSPSNGSVGLQQGDLLFYFQNGAHHVTMYIGNGRLVHASSPGVGVVTQDLWTPWNTQHFTSAARPPGIGVVGEDATDQTSTNPDDKEDKSNQRVVKTTRNVFKNAVALSSVHGTPQTARFAALNVSNETVYLNTDSELINGADGGLLNIVARTIIPGDKYELKKTIPGGKNSFEVIIDTDFIQDQEQASAVASLLSRSFSYQYKAINVKIFGNPLVQLGDIVKFNYYSGKVVSGVNDWYIVTSVRHNFSQGLETNLTIKPLVETSYLEQLNS